MGKQMIVQLDIPGDVFFRLAGIADRDHMKVADLLRAAAHDMADGERVGANRWKHAQEQALLVMIAADWTDKAIAEALGFSRGAVSDRRRLLGVVRPAHPGRPTHLEQERRSA